MRERGNERLGQNIRMVIMNFTQNHSPLLLFCWTTFIRHYINFACLHPIIKGHCHPFRMTFNCPALPQSIDQRVIITSITNAVQFLIAIISRSFSVLCPPCHQCCCCRRRRRHNNHKIWNFDCPQLQFNGPSSPHCHRRAAPPTNVIITCGWRSTISN